MALHAIFVDTAREGCAREAPKWRDSSLPSLMAEGPQWRRLTAERKFRIFLETRGAETPVGEILRRHGLTLEDLRAIEEAVEQVQAGHWRLAREVTAEEHARVCRELREKERALAELSVEYTLLKKNELGLTDRGDGAGSPPRRSRRSSRR